MDRMPPEIWTMCFILLDFRERQRILSVCQQWRQVALSIGELWGSAEVYSERGLSWVLQHSAQAKLRLQLHESESSLVATRMVSLLQPHLSRLHTLDLELLDENSAELLLTVSMPTLDTLRIRIRVLRQLQPIRLTARWGVDQVPRLRVLELPTVVLPEDTLPFVFATTIKLTFNPMPNPKILFQIFPSAKSLIIPEGTGTMPSGPLPPNIEHLRIQFRHESIAEDDATRTLPTWIPGRPDSLQRVSISDLPDEAYTILMDFILSPKPQQPWTLMAFAATELDDSDWDDSAYIITFPAGRADSDQPTPALTCTWWTGHFEEFMSQITRYCASLETFHLDNRTLIDILGSMRETGGLVLSGVTEFHLAMSSGDEYPFEAWTLAWENEDLQSDEAIELPNLKKAIFELSRLWPHDHYKIDQMHDLFTAESGYPRVLRELLRFGHERTVSDIDVVLLVPSPCAKRARDKGLDLLSGFLSLGVKSASIEEQWCLESWRPSLPVTDEATIGV